MNYPTWAKPAAIGAALATTLLWAQAPTAQTARGPDSSLVIDREGNVWHASGSAVRRCYFQESGFGPICSAWQ